MHERLGRNAAGTIISAQPKKAGGISINIIHAFTAGQRHREPHFPQQRFAVLIPLPKGVCEYRSSDTAMLIQIAALLLNILREHGLVGSLAFPRFSLNAIPSVLLRVQCKGMAGDFHISGSRNRADILPGEMGIRWVCIHTCRSLVGIASDQWR